MTILDTINSLQPGAIVDLWTLDATLLGGSVYYFSSTKEDGSDGVTFGGQLYTGVPLEAKGFDWNSADQAQRPTVRMPSYVQLTLTDARAYGWFIGAKVTRRMTFAQHIDSGSDPDTTAIYRSDIYTLSRRKKHTALEIEYELRAITDITHRKVPNRQVLPNTCTRVYRRWTGAAFDYTNVDCPWGSDDPDGGNYFDEQNNTTTAANDKCRKTLSACKARYTTNSLPTHAFPGVGNVRPGT